MSKTPRQKDRAMRLKLLGAFYVDRFYSKDPKPVTVLDLARKFKVTPPTIYKDLEILRLKLGAFYIPNKVPYGGNRYGRR